ncbi:MAG: DUF2071 domain-containing protein [Acidobacteriota bacterium]
MPETHPAFLTAEWRHLALLTFEADPGVLRPFVPRGTELDTHAGRALVSLVGFRFLDTRVLGFRIPFHRDFEEVNLRFYVRRETRGESRRGVTFIREIVPRRLIASVARLAYNEPYVALPMRSEISDRPRRVRYAWKSPAGWQSMSMSARGDPVAPEGGGEISFITDHEWGYSRQRDGGTREYRVVHPLWRVATGAEPRVSGDLGVLYGPALGEIVARAAVSALLAEGSPVTVYRAGALDFPGPPTTGAR